MRRGIYCDFMALFQDRERRNQEIDRLVVLSQQGDTEAFAQIYDMLVVPIYRYIYYRVHAGDAEDLTEMVFLKAWENLLQYQKTQYSFSAWLFKIARNLVVDYYRAHTFSEELDPSLPDTRREADPEAYVENVLDQQTLKTALSRLKESYQQVIILKFINDLPNSEIARIMGRSEGTVRILQFRALAALKRILEV